MKPQFKFDHYVLGFVCLLIVCILPAISSVVYFINNNNGIMPYLLIFVAIMGILYEYPPDKDAENILKIEQFAVYVSSFLFLSADLVVFIIRADAKAYTYNRFDYILMGYVIVPAIVTIIEIIRSAMEYLRIKPNDTTPNNTTPKNQVANDKSVNV